MYSSIFISLFLSNSSFSFSSALSSRIFFCWVYNFSNFKSLFLSSSFNFLFSNNFFIDVSCWSNSSKEVVSSGCSSGINISSSSSSSKFCPFSKFFSPPSSIFGSTIFCSFGWSSSWLSFSFLIGLHESLGWVI